MRYDTWEKLDEATTPQEMRAAMFKISRDEVIIRNGLRYRDMTGCTGEDTWTMIAYYAIKIMAEYRTASHNAFLSMPPMQIIIDKTNTTATETVSRTERKP